MDTRNPDGNGSGGSWNAGSGGPNPPNLEDILRQGQNRLRGLLPGGIGGGRRWALIAAAAVVVWLASGFYMVQPDERGVPMIFGSAQGTTLPGLNYNWPAPIGKVFKPKVTRVNQTEVGFTRRADNGAAGGIVPEESLMLTGDENIIEVRSVTLWRINDPTKFLFNVRNPAETVKTASEAAMREVMGGVDFEFARTQGRVRLQQRVASLIQSILDDYGAGIEVTDVNLQQIDPPASIMGAFRDVQAARADRENVINEATAYLNEITERAAGQAFQILSESEAYKREKIAVATGESERFLSVLAQYRIDGFVTRRRIYLETMRNVLQGMDKVLIDNPRGGRNTTASPRRLPVLPGSRPAIGR